MTRQLRVTPSPHHRCPPSRPSPSYPIPLPPSPPTTLSSFPRFISVSSDNGLGSRIYLHLLHVINELSWGRSQQRAAGRRAGSVVGREAEKESMTKGSMRTFHLAAGGSRGSHGTISAVLSCVTPCTSLNLAVSVSSPLT